MESKKEHIKVSVRIRPLLSQDSTNSSSLRVISTEPPVLLVEDRSQTYHFDNIFAEDADQEKVYNDAVKPFVNWVKRGYNSTVFAYGQSGTGKTYTMGSATQKFEDSYHTGIIPRALEQLFDEVHFDSNEKINIYVSFMEIYNKKVFDLLDTDNKKPLSVSGFTVPNLSRKHVQNVSQARDLLEFGHTNRHVGKTNQNSNSSRSHAIFSVHYTRKNECEEICGKLNLVDLAGSESVKKTGSKANTFQEGIDINQGLLAIGRVISALSGKANFIPYRESMITTILQGSLNIDNYISLIACVSANLGDTTETLQTLDFAQRAKKIRGNPDLNSVIAKFKKENNLMYGSGRTPMKRPNSTPFKTPLNKRFAPSSLPLITENNHNLVSNVDNSKNQFSLSSISSIKLTPPTDITPQVLSPLLRKYVTRLEVSIMNRLETVIQSTLRRPTRASLLSKTLLDDSQKENTRKYSDIEITNMDTFQAANIIRATSSPIEIEARRLLSYDSPEIDTLTSMGVLKSTALQEQAQKNFSFKRPKLPPDNRIVSRRSVRLSVKGTAKLDANSTLNISEVSFKKKRGRRTKGVTTSSFKINQETSITESIRKDGVADDSVSKEELSINESFPRRSIRIATLNSPHVENKRKSFGTPPRTLQSTKPKEENKDTPYTTHSKKVLRVLNQGTQNDISKLHLIGPKTAEQILLFRKLQGHFTELEDLRKIPGWGTKKYEKFASMNFLRRS